MSMSETVEERWKEDSDPPHKKTLITHINEDGTPNTGNVIEVLEFQDGAIMVGYENEPYHEGSIYFYSDQLELFFKLMRDRARKVLIATE